MTVYSFSTQY